MDAPRVAEGGDEQQPAARLGDVVRRPDGARVGAALGAGVAHLDPAPAGCPSEAEVKSRRGT